MPKDTCMGALRPIEDETILRTTRVRNNKFSGTKLLIIKFSFDPEIIERTL